MMIEKEWAENLEDTATVLAVLLDHTRLSLSAWEAELAPIEAIPAWSNRVERMRATIATLHKRLRVLEDLAYRAGVRCEGVDRSEGSEYARQRFTAWIRSDE